MPRCSAASPSWNGAGGVTDRAPCSYARFLGVHGRTAYFGTAILAGGNQFSFVYAVRAATGPPPPSPPTQCVVPGVVAMPLDAARAQIIDAGCSVGNVKRVRSQQIGIVVLRARHQARRCRRARA